MDASFALDTAEDVKSWRSRTRKALVSQRVSVPADEHARWSRAIDAHLESLVADMAFSVVGFCWPYQAEHDARPTVLRLLARGARAALPVIVAPRTPLAFREWQPDCEMEEGAHGIPVPAPSAATLVADLVLLPVNGFDARGYRLGYGSGYFDRTLASLEKRPVVVGTGFELGRLATIHPQPHDIPLDFIVTEAGVFPADPRAGLGLR